jgi:2-C-methyl-D-erythritol 2,4-cyclodiphosphate synthase
VTVRTGIGYDSHRLVEGRPLILGGVRVPSELGLDGHSDADVLTHAVIDALLGAAGLEDIGHHFPDTDERWKDADSIALLGRVMSMVQLRKLRLVNVDTTIMIERPKLAPHRDKIRASLAGGLGLQPEYLNIKATTGEGIGFIGRGEGIAVLAVATLELVG